MNDLFEMFKFLAPIILTLAFVLISIITVFYKLFCFLERRLGRKSAIALYLIAVAVALFSIFPFWWAVGIYTLGLCMPQLDKELNEYGKARWNQKMYEIQRRKDE